MKFADLSECKTQAQVNKLVRMHTFGQELKADLLGAMLEAWECRQRLRSIARVLCAMESSLGDVNPFFEKLAKPIIRRPYMRGRAGRRIKENQ